MVKSLVALLFCKLVILIHCDNGYASRCEGKREIVFLLDMSGSIGFQHFEEMKQFVVDIIQQFYVGPYNTQFGVELFSTGARTAIKLNQYSSKSSLIRAVKRIRYKGGWTNTYLGLDRLRLYSFSALYGRRHGVPKIGIVVTDGNSQDQKATFRAAKRAKNSGIRLFALGIGSSISEYEIKGIASSTGKRKREAGPKRMLWGYRTRRFSSLKTNRIQNLVIGRTCSVGTMVGKYSKTPKR